MTTEPSKRSSTWIIALAIVVGFAVGAPVTALIVTRGGGKDNPTPTPLVVATAEPTVEPTAQPAPTPNFIAYDVERLTQSQVTTFPTGAKAINCNSATYHSGNHIWSVTCECFANLSDTAPKAGDTFTY